MWRLSLLFSLCACSATFGQDELDVVEIGTPLDATKQEFLPYQLSNVRLLVDSAGLPWLAAPSTSRSHDVSTIIEAQGGLYGDLHLHRIAAPYGDYQLQNAGISVFSPTPSRSICSYRISGEGENATWMVSFRHPDEPVAAEFSSGPMAPQILCGQQTMVYFQDANNNSYMDVLRRTADGVISHQQLPWPLDARIDYQQGPYAFDDTETVLLATDGDYRTLAYYLDTPEVLSLDTVYWGQSHNGRYIYIDLDGEIHVFDVANHAVTSIGFRLGPYGQVVGIDERGQEIITCDWDGLRAVTLPQPQQVAPNVAKQRVLDATPCRASTSALPTLSLVTYTPLPDWNHLQNSELRAVRVDGTKPPTVLTRGYDNRILGICQDRAVAYSLDPTDRYGPSVSDGWIGNQRFMERGRDVRFATDCNRIYFKEHAANVRKLGELRSAELPSSAAPELFQSGELPSRQLGRNVGFNRMTADGRLLAAVDLAVVGPQNRLQLIDVERGVAESLVHSINGISSILFLNTFLPQSQEVLLEVHETEPGRQSGILRIVLPQR